MGGMRQNALYRPGGQGQTVNYTNASAVSTDAIGKNVPQDERSDVVGVYLVATTDCWVEIGAAPVAAVDTSTFLPAYVPVMFDAHAGDKVAVWRDAVDGKLRVRPLRVVQ